MGTWKTGVENFSGTTGESRSHLLEKERPLPPDEKLKAINKCGLDAVKKEEATKHPFSFSENPTEEDESNNCKMASQIGNPGERII